MKPKVAFYWCASCGGCDEAILDLELELLNVAAAVDIVLWPVALDFKEHDIAALPEDSIAVTFINGAIRTDEQLRMARLLRQKSRLIVAFGACAQLGGIPGLANLTDRQSILREAYGEKGGPQPETRLDGHTLTLPILLETVLPLDRVLPVEYYVPGCPPSPKVTADAIHAILDGTLPPPGAVLAPDRAMCEECERKDTHPEQLTIERFRRIQDGPVDPNICILAQGLPCLGPVTRAGCGARCISGNMPCTGCFGPTSHVRDFGAKALCSLASVCGETETVAIDRAYESLPDLCGTVYRYSLPSSFLERKRQEVRHDS